MVLVGVRVILGFLGVVNWGSIRRWVIFGLFGVVLEGFGVKGWGSIRSRAVLRYLDGVVLRNLGVVLGLFGDVTRDRVILRGSV